jgi:hypothetical protein
LETRARPQPRSLNGSSLTVGNLMQTMMAYEDPLMTQESAIARLCCLPIPLATQLRRPFSSTRQPAWTVTARRNGSCVSQWVLPFAAGWDTIELIL